MPQTHSSFLFPLRFSISLRRRRRRPFNKQQLSLQISSSTRSKFWKKDLIKPLQFFIDHIIIFFKNYFSEFRFKNVSSEFFSCG